MTENQLSAIIVDTCYHIHVELGVHKKQVLTYLRLSEIKLGLLINFNEALIKDGITRIVNHL